MAYLIFKKESKILLILGSFSFASILCKLILTMYILLIVNAFRKVLYTIPLEDILFKRNQVLSDSLDFR